MNCPFLKEAEVKYCRSSPVRKLIPLAQARRAEERCSSENYPECPVFRQQPDAEGLAAFGRCPFLQESLMQYCGAAPVAKFVPYSESLLTRCGNGRYRYCELFLQMAHPLPAPQVIEGIALPDELGYSQNHLWVDEDTDGSCHVGIDAFLSRVLGPVERIAFAWQKGHHRPTAVVTTSGADLGITLPFPMHLTDCNLYLRANPERLTSEPYTRGWLFAGVADRGAAAGLLRGERARHWMEGEVHRIHEFLQQLPGPAGPTAADGGLFSPGLPRCIEREHMFALFQEFFSPLREQEVKS